MNRIGVLSTLVVMLASSPSFAQFGGAGGVGGQGMTPGMVMQRGGIVGPGFTEFQRSVQVEMEGGQRLSGRIDLRPLIVDGDLGQYFIAPDKIKMIRFLKPANEVEANGDGEGGGGDEGALIRLRPQGRGAAVRAVRGGGGGGGNGGDMSDMTVMTRGKVITTTDKEIIGFIHIPTDFRLDLDFGSLNLSPPKLRSITFTGENREHKPAKGEAAVPRTSEDRDRLATSEATCPPRYFRQGNSLIVISSVGDRVTLFDLETKKSQSLELSGSKDAPLEVTPIIAQNLVALRLKGSGITRIAVADTESGTWHPQGLRSPIEGRAVPIVAPGVVVYNLGRDVYAYGAEAQRWDVAELPEGARTLPFVGPGTATIDSQGHIYTFSSKTGKWGHFDVRAILDVGGAKKK